jgi:hypothetical protein
MLLHADSESLRWFVFCTLAGWRFTRLICYDSGPFDVMVAVRRLLYRFGLHRLAECFHCAAVWVSILAVVAVYRLDAKSVVVAAALAGAVSLVELYFQGSRPAPEKDEA